MFLTQKMPFSDTFYKEEKKYRKNGFLGPFFQFYLKRGIKNCKMYYCT